VFGDEFRCEWRQFPMPVNNLGSVVVDRGVHIDTSASSNRTTRFQWAGALTGEKRVRCVCDDSLRTRTAMRAFHTEEVGRMLSLEQEKCLGASADARPRVTGHATGCELFRDQVGILRRRMRPGGGFMMASPVQYKVAQAASTPTYGALFEIAVAPGSRDRRQ